MPSNPTVELQLGDSTEYPELKYRGMTIATRTTTSAGRFNLLIGAGSNKPHAFTSTKAALVCSI